MDFECRMELDNCCKDLKFGTEAHLVLLLHSHCIGWNSGSLASDWKQLSPLPGPELTLFAGANLISRSGPHFVKFLLCTQ